MPGKEFFHQGHAQTLRDAAFDLSFDQRGIDRAPDVMRRRHFQHAHRSQFHIDFDLRHVRAKAVDRVWRTLPVFIERSDRRIECLFAGDDISVLIERN